VAGGLVTWRQGGRSLQIASLRVQIDAAAAEGDYASALALVDELVALDPSSPYGRDKRGALATLNAEVAAEQRLREERAREAQDRERTRALARTRVAAGIQLRRRAEALPGGSAERQKLENEALK